MTTEAELMEREARTGQRLIPIADELDLEYDPPDEGCIHVELSGSWYVDESKLLAFSDRLAELINEYRV